MNFFRKISVALDDRSARLAGIALMLAGVCMFSFGDALGKFIVATYSVGQFMLLRACAALVLIGPSMWRARAEFARVERPWLQVVRIVLSTLEIAAFFLAVVYLPLADVTTYYLATPIFVTALSAVVLRGDEDRCGQVIGRNIGERQIDHRHKKRRDLQRRKHDPHQLQPRPLDASEFGTGAPH